MIYQIIVIFSVVGLEAIEKYKIDDFSILEENIASKSMASTQQQNLSLFSDNSLISDQILRSDSSSMSVISHIQGTSPSWLLNSLIENSLQGTAVQVNNELTKRATIHPAVFFISFIHSKDFYVQNCKKNGLDLDTMPNFKFIDRFSNLFTKDIGNVEDGDEVIEKCFESIYETVSANRSNKKVVFIEMPELLLSATNVSSNQLLYALMKINKQCCHLNVVASKNSPQQVDFDSMTDSDPVFKLTDFLVKLYHRSQLNLSLMPLSTGKASDVTGCLVVSRGCLPFPISQVKVEERKYIYYLTKESNVKLYFH